MTKMGALAGIVVGGTTVVIWGNMSGGILDLYEIIPGFIFATFAIIIVSKLGATKPNVHASHDNIMKKMT